MNKCPICRSELTKTGLIYEDEIVYTVTLNLGNTIQNSTISILKANINFLLIQNLNGSSSKVVEKENA